MAKRIAVRKYDTDSVQGEGSFVVMSSLKVGETRKLRKLVASDDVDEVFEGLKLLSKHVVDWNWVDDNDELMPLPEGKIAVMDELTNEEVEVLSDLLIGANEKK